MPSIAKSQLYGKNGSKTRIPVLVTISVPAKDPRGGTRCRVRLGSIESPRNVYGEDSMQALALSFVFLEMRLRALRSEGWQFYYGQRDRTPIDVISCWFPSVRLNRKPSSSSFESRRAIKPRAAQLRR